MISGGALAMGALMGSALSASAQGGERHTLSGSEVAIYNLAGTISVQGGASGGDVVVEVTRRGSDRERLKVATGSVRGRESLRVIFPERQIVFRRDGARNWGGSTRVDVADDGTFGDNGRGRHRWGEGDEFEISSSGRGFEGYAEVKVVVPKGKRVELHLAAGDASASNVDGDLSIDVGAASVTTNHTRGMLSLDTGSGEVSVTDANGELRLDSGSGSVTLAGVKGDNLRIDSGSGSIRGSNVDADVLTLDSGSGSVRIDGVRSRSLDIDSGSGSVELQLTADVEKLRAEAGSGRITLGIPESLGAELRVETGSGGIDIDFPVTITHRDHDSLSGTIGDGRGRIQIESGSGGVRLRRNTR